MSCYRILGLLLFVSLIGSVQAAEPAQKPGVEKQTRNAKLLDRLVAAYPDFLRGHDGTVLIWNDGTRMIFDADRGQKKFSERLNKPDLADMFHFAYPFGASGIPPQKNADPGRIRYEPFFRKMYGDSRASVRKTLVPIKWLPSKQGKRVMVTSVNGVAAKLQKISDALDKLPRRFDKFLIPARRADHKFVPGIFNWRCIRGTQRLSVHSFGAAIDLVFLQYWRTQLRKKGIRVKGTTDCRANQPRLPKGAQNFKFSYKNTMPWEIVHIFERHGFIWGGKWAHYDTMHFEYRPELLPPSVRQ